RSSVDRKRKIKYANYAKKIIPYHRWIGTSALVFIIFHAYMVIGTFGFDLLHIKSLSGFITGMTLVGMVSSGWLRLVWPSKRKRMTHLYLGITLFFSFSYMYGYSDIHINHDCSSVGTFLIYIKKANELIVCLKNASLDLLTYCLDTFFYPLRHFSGILYRCIFTIR